MRRLITDKLKIAEYNNTEVDEQQETIHKIIHLVKWGSKVRPLKTNGYKKETRNILLQHFSRDSEYLIEVLKNGSVRVRVTNIREDKDILKLKKDSS